MEINWQKTEDGGFTAQYLDYELRVRESRADGFWYYSLFYFGTKVDGDGGWVSPNLAQARAISRMQKRMKDSGK